MCCVGTEGCDRGEELLRAVAWRAKAGRRSQGSRSLKRKRKEIGAGWVLIGPDNHATIVPPNRSQSGSQGCEKTGVLRDPLPLSKGSGSIEARQP